MSMISNLVEELIDNADLYTKELHDLMYRAAETIEVLSEKARECFCRLYVRWQGQQWNHHGQKYRAGLPRSQGR